MKIEFSLKELPTVAETLINSLTSNVVSIEGPMGAGKTTLITALCKTLKIDEEVSSPTFALVNTYNSNKGVIYHFDFYRLEHPNEALDIGVEEYFDSGRLCFLEWAEKITPHLPHQYNRFKISVITPELRMIETTKT